MSTDNKFITPEFSLLFTAFGGSLYLDMKEPNDTPQKCISLKTLLFLLFVFSCLACSSELEMYELKPEIQHAQKTLMVDRKANKNVYTSISSNIDGTPYQFLTSPQYLTIGDNIPSEVLIAAERGVDEWAHVFYDFNILEEHEDYIDHIKLGIPYELTIIKLRELKENMFIDIDDIWDTPSWFFPLIIKKKVSYWMEVRNKKNGWKAIGVGGSSDAVLTAMIERKALFEDDNVKKTILMIPGVNISFVGYKWEEDDFGYVEYHLPSSQEGPFTFDEAIEIYRQKAKNIRI